MTTKNAAIEQVRDEVRETVRKSTSPMAPIELITRLRTLGLNENRVRGAMWYLLDQREIELTPDWKLRVQGQPLTVK
jgi:hypothetical protein